MFRELEAGDALIATNDVDDSWLVLRNDGDGLAFLRLAAGYVVVERAYADETVIPEAFEVARAHGDELDRSQAWGWRGPA